MKKSKRNQIPVHNVFSSAGSSKYIGEAFDNNIDVEMVQYNSDEIIMHDHVELLECNRKIIQKYVNWVDVTGIHQPNKIEEIGKTFGLHSLIIEDILNTTQKPKFEFYEDDNLIFIILKVPRIEESKYDIDFEHIAIVLSDNYLISFQEMDKNDVFDPILARLNKLPSKTRKNKADYLLYSLIDVVVDNYYLVNSKIEEILSNLESEILSSAKVEHQKKLYYLKKEILQLKKALVPTKEILINLLRDDDKLISKNTKIYLRDVHDHVIENIGSVDSFKDEIENLITNYHSQLSDRMNSVMKTLTVFTAIFMPLTFIAGIYGMNFKNMPELESNNGYYVTITVMILIGLVQWIYFSWKKYL